MNLIVRLTHNLPEKYKRTVSARYKPHQIIMDKQISWQFYNEKKKRTAECTW